MSETLQQQAVHFVDTTAKPNGDTAAARKPDRRIGRAVKIGLAGLLMTGAAGAALVSQGRVTADNAVVSAYVLSLRSPIQGDLSGLRLRVGDGVSGIEVLARVEDERANDERLTDLRSDRARTEAELTALLEQRRTLLELRAKLVMRSDDFRLTQTAYALAGFEEAKAQLVASEIRQEQARRDMARKAFLGRTGDAALATVDHAMTDTRAAEADVASQTSRLASFRIRETAARRGLSLDNGGNDASYSAQRIDDVDLRLADIDRMTGVLEAARGMAGSRLAAEERRFSALARADLRLPVRGMVWKLGASNGERVGIGETVAQVIDCETSFIVAAIPQREFASVELGGVARFRLAGEKVDRKGRVLSVIGDASVSGDRNLAAAPVVEHTPTAIVRIEVPPSGNGGAECLVGRTARVLLPTSGGGMAQRMLRWLG